MGFLIRVLANALAILAAAYILPGIEVSGGMALLAAGVVLALINAVVRPVLIFLTLPVTLVTLGLFLFVLNAFCLWLTSWLVKGFEVQGFWPAVFGAMLVSVVSWLVNAFLSDQGQVVVITGHRRFPDGDVIDISPKH
ncbi:MAG: phage holin family protein [Nitrospirae bacterium]|nr:MAG: phage holin family protein [Nitrospirota bacterium]